MTAGAVLLDGTVKSSVILLAALAAIACLRRQSAALRHWVLSCAIAAAALVPLLGPVTPPAWRVPLDALPGARLVAIPASSSAPAAEPHRSMGPPANLRTAAGVPTAGIVTFITATWIAGTCVSALILFVGLGRLGWIASSARQVRNGRWAVAAESIARGYGLRRPAVILQSDRPALLVTWGLVVPKIILPQTAESWTDARIRVVLSHELAHVKRHDWLIQILAEIARAGHWFNPLMWVACRRLRQESEQAADDVVLRAGGLDGSEYAGHLLEMARDFSHRRPWLPAPAIARPSSLERRVSAMLNTSVNRGPVTPTVRAGIVAAALCVATVLAAAQGAFSTFSGTVFDPLNGYLPGVTRTLTHTQSGAKHEIRSDRTGHFEFVGLPPGAYALQAILPGFSVLQGTLDLAGGSVQRDVTLKIAQLTETVSVRPSRTDASAPPAAPALHPAPGKFAAMNGCPQTTSSAGTMGGNLRAPTKLVDRKPVYPGQLAEAGIGGVLVFQARIGSDGTIIDLQSVSTANPDLELAASSAIRQWEFTPTLLNCVPIEVPMRVTVNFSAQ